MDFPDFGDNFEASEWDGRIFIWCLVVLLIGAGALGAFLALTSETTDPTAASKLLLYSAGVIGAGLLVAIGRILYVRWFK